MHLSGHTGYRRSLFSAGLILELSEDGMSYWYRSLMTSETSLKWEILESVEVRRTAISSSFGVLSNLFVLRRERGSGAWCRGP